MLARIDHAAAAEAAGLSLRPTELLLFGRPQGGTPLMQSRQTAGIDLPLKALAWEDTDGQVWLGVNDPAWIADRHGIEGESAAAAVDALADVLVRLAATATAQAL